MAAAKVSFKPIHAGLLMLLIAVMPVYAEETVSSNDTIAKLKTQLDLQDDQVFNITPIIEKYSMEFQGLEKSIEDGTINESAIDSQRQGLEAAETQELSQYLKPNQLSQWRGIQSQMYQQYNDNSDGNAGADQYSNLPNNPPQD